MPTSYLWIIYCGCDRSGVGMDMEWELFKGGVKIEYRQTGYNHTLLVKCNRDENEGIHILTMICKYMGDLWPE